MNRAETDVSLSNDSGIDIPLDEQKVQEIVAEISKGEEKNFKFVEVVCVDEDEILGVNNDHLGHDYVTDIITFHYHEEGADPEGSLVCCAHRIKEQALEFDSSYETEFVRIIIHGLLHLCGYQDADKDQKQQMSDKENDYLRILQYI